MFLEVGNGLWARVRSGKSGADEVASLLADLDGFEFRVHPLHSHVARALTIATTFNHPIYDCLYLALAESLDIALVAADKRFLAAVRSAELRGVEVKALAELG